MIIKARARDIGGFAVRRVLPAIKQRSVGPFIFFDHMGPVELPAGRAMDVPPHPHINLATVTYLFEGEVDHRDSLGTFETIRAGEINWMTAGRGVVHSERTPAALRDAHATVHGIQAWVALPEDLEDGAPSFTHYSRRSLPEATIDGAHVRVLIGDAYAQQSPVTTLSPLFYVDAALPAGTRLPVDMHYPERALYVVSGEVSCAGEQLGEAQMFVLPADESPSVEATSESRVMLLGGAPLGSRHMWWNFVSSSKDRLEEAKAIWANGPDADARFPKIPGDDKDFVPLPD